MHDNKGSSQIRRGWVMVVGCACSNDIRRADQLSVEWALEKLFFFYHRQAASCTSAERDLHSPSADVRVIGNSAMITESGDHEETVTESAHLWLTFLREPWQGEQRLRGCLWQGQLGRLAQPLVP